MATDQQYEIARKALAVLMRNAFKALVKFGLTPNEAATFMHDAVSDAIEVH